MHVEDKNTIVLKHPMTPEKKLDIPRATLANDIVSNNGLIPLYDASLATIVAVKGSATGLIAIIIMKTAKASTQRMNAMRMRQPGPSHALVLKLQSHLGHVGPPLLGLDLFL